MVEISRELQIYKDSDFTFYIIATDLKHEIDFAFCQSCVYETHDAIESWIMKI